MAVNADPIFKAASVIKEADNILITAGAGMGVDSGLPDFRGSDGFWRSYPPYKKLGLNFYDMANPVTFSKDPRLAWGFYGHRLSLYKKTVPHFGFDILKKWVSDSEKNYFVFTSNVDGHFQKKGFSSNKIVECHGSINHFQCSKPCSGKIFSDEPEIKIDELSMRLVTKIPVCSDCGAVIRPNILMFGDFSWIPDRTNDQYGRLQKWAVSIRDGRSAVIEIGAGTAVPTVRIFSENFASSHNATHIRINPNECKCSGISLKMSSIDALKKIDEIIRAI